MKILLATDGSPHSKAIVKKFADQTFADQTEVRIITAYEGSSYLMNISPMGALSEYYTKIDNASLEIAEDAIENAATILRATNPKLSVTVAAIDGAAKNVILQEAERFGADLIVIGSHGHGAIAGFLLGSVSQAVALNAKCSVAIVRI